VVKPYSVPVGAHFSHCMMSAESRKSRCVPCCAERGCAAAVVRGGRWLRHRLVGCCCARGAGEQLLMAWCVWDSMLLPASIVANDLEGV
jgi:hypothetical protein